MLTLIWISYKKKKSSLYQLLSPPPPPLQSKKLYQIRIHSNVSKRLDPIHIPIFSKNFTFTLYSTVQHPLLQSKKYFNTNQMVKHLKKRGEKLQTRSIPVKENSRKNHVNADSVFFFFFWPLKSNCSYFKNSPNAFSPVISTSRVIFNFQFRLVFRTTRFVAY